MIIAVSLRDVAWAARHAAANTMMLNLVGRAARGTNLDLDLTLKLARSAHTAGLYSVNKYAIGERKPT